MKLLLLLADTAKVLTVVDVTLLEVAGSTLTFTPATSTMAH